MLFLTWTVIFTFYAYCHIHSSFHIPYQLSIISQLGAFFNILNNTPGKSCNFFLLRLSLSNSFWDTLIVSSCFRVIVISPKFTTFCILQVQFFCSYSVSLYDVQQMLGIFRISKAYWTTMCMFSVCIARKKLVWSVLLSVAELIKYLTIWMDEAMALFNFKSRWFSHEHQMNIARQYGFLKCKLRTNSLVR